MHAHSPSDNCAPRFRHRAPPEPGRCKAVAYTRLNAVLHGSFEGPLINLRTQMPDEPVISVQDIGKTYRIWESPAKRLLSPAYAFGAQVVPGRWSNRLRNASGQGYRDFSALDGVSFEVRRGEAVGIIGRNGSGKSTLLQIIAGTLQPSRGLIQVKGRVAALLELGSGFNPDFTGRENIFVNGAVLGLSRAEVEARYDSIAAFADIGEFINHPVKTYSTGMMMRLAFAVATSVDPEILIVDEALSVGDVFFNQKCFTRIRQILDSGTSLLFVSHDISAVRNLCDRAILLVNGTKAYEGPPEEAASRYYALSPTASAAALPNRAQATAQTEERGRLLQVIEANDVRRKARSEHGAGGLTIEQVAVLDETGQATRNFTVGAKLVLAVRLRATADITDPSCGLHLYDRMNNLIFAAGTRQLRVPLADFRAGDERVVELRVELAVHPGEYTFSVGCSQRSSDGPNAGYALHRLEGLGPVAVTAAAAVTEDTWPFYGMARLPMEIRVHG